MTIASLSIKNLTSSISQKSQPEIKKCPKKTSQFYISCPKNIGILNGATFSHPSTPLGAA